MTDDIRALADRLERGICDEGGPCRVKDAASGCDCAAAATALRDLSDRLAKAEDERDAWAEATTKAIEYQKDAEARLAKAEAENERLTKLEAVAFRSYGREQNANHVLTDQRNLAEARLAKATDALRDAHDIAKTSVGPGYEVIAEKARATLAEIGDSHDRVR